ncbi:MAG TPA: GspH/FimT family pseudopilin [Steroidobacteraceae bacterium]
MRHQTITSGHTAPPRGRRSARLTRQAGITLIELLTVLVIVVILISIGMPSYRYVTTSNRVATESDALLGDLQYARAEAIREGQQVTVCVSSNGSSCDAATLPPAWQEGWIIFSNPNNVTTVDAADPLMRADKGFSGNGDTFQSSNNTYAINFSGNGFANLGVASMLITLHNSTAASQYTRCVLISQVGMTSVVTNSTTGCT